MRYDAKCDAHEKQGVTPGKRYSLHTRRRKNAPSITNARRLLGKGLPNPSLTFVQG